MTLQLEISNPQDVEFILVRRINIPFKQIREKSGQQKAIERVRNSALFLCFFTLLFCKNNSVQPAQINSENHTNNAAQSSQLSLEAQLLGYWLYEGTNRSPADDGNYYNTINKLYFTPDSLFISNFGGITEHVNASQWYCVNGKWKINGDTLDFFSRHKISFSNNTGKYYHSKSIVEFFFSGIIKSVNKDNLTLTLFRRTNSNGTIEAETRVYKKMKYLNLYGQVNPYSSDARWAP